ncbi:MAG: leucine-rich repeat domain-containing protein, partial [Clostridia bacterium]
IAKVTAGGLVTAVAKGGTQIVCTPTDAKCAPVVCNVTVEDAFTVLTGTGVVDLYLQGDKKNEVATYWLSQGTVNRLAGEGIVPQWKLEGAGHGACKIDYTVADDAAKISIRTTDLMAGGTDKYTISCKAGTHSWSGELAVNVIDLGNTAPQGITLAKQTYTANVGAQVVLDFKPTVSPVGATIPEGMGITYVGLADFYDALDKSRYTENGDQVTAAFNVPGSYLLTRQYKKLNLHYVTMCTVNVGDVLNPQSLNVLSCTEPEQTVYVGGCSADIAWCTINDQAILETFASQLTWKAQRLSGNCLAAGLTVREGKAALFVANVKCAGTEVWRISCDFGGVTDSVDITIHAIAPRKALPDSLELSTNKVDAVIGNWQSLPIGCRCVPNDTALPDSADNFWSLKMADGAGKYVTEWKIEKGMLRVRFTESGYYMGNLIYHSGNVRYELPVYFTVKDEENIVHKPNNLGVHIVNNVGTVYPEGRMNVEIADAVLGSGLDGYTASVGATYAKIYGATWTVVNTSGSACTLAVEPNGDGRARIMLRSVQGTGDVNFSVTCSVNGESFTRNGAIHVASAGEARPKPVLKKTAYTTTVGTNLTIDAGLYDQDTGSLLMGGSTQNWINDAILAAIGYEYVRSEGSLAATFYEAGTYNTTVTACAGNLRYEIPVTIEVLADQETGEPNVLKMPTALKKIDQEAFMGGAMEVVDLRGTKLEAIGERAFRNCSKLRLVYIPESVTSIGVDAFAGCLVGLTICCKKGSGVETYANNNGFKVSYMAE